MAALVAENSKRCVWTNGEMAIFLEWAHETNMNSILDWQPQWNAAMCHELPPSCTLLLLMQWYNSWLKKYNIFYILIALILRAATSISLYLTIKRFCFRVSVSSEKHIYSLRISVTLFQSNSPKNMKGTNSLSHTVLSTLYLWCQEVGRVECFRFLGVYICADFTWSTLTHCMIPWTKYFLRKWYYRPIRCSKNRLTPDFHIAKHFWGNGRHELAPTTRVSKVVVRILD